ncbi:MAG: hypothetical protein GY710_26675 [Desulfobacteraceae bacterium]|nr:hypothetical protein [Desulfobacteraceae bacterium]
MPETGKEGKACSGFEWQRVPWTGQSASHLGNRTRSPVRMSEKPYLSPRRSLLNIPEIQMILAHTIQQLITMAALTRLPK